ncbi:hypothetical protein [Hymenobacter sp. BT190]|uniref:hypothetical protein n=1 Tax=Hymenobacter sp. BT190 TaxID=2763505 RepID=UPI0016512DD4|nr:hypothetical protein [Hymenobacter sp. BT190]MBC6697341.1 hypothetical protein [Hymenobacter sp. BT190]
MPSVLTAPAAPTVGAAASRLAALQARLDQLCAPRPASPPPPAPAPVDPAVVAVRRELARTQSALFDARAARYALRDTSRPGPGRFAQLRAAVVRYQQARAAYAAAAAVFHASPAGAALQAARARYPRF